MCLFCGKMLRCKTNKSIILSVDGAKNMCSSDGVSLTFSAVVRCSLIFLRC